VNILKDFILPVGVVVVAAAIIGSWVKWTVLSTHPFAGRRFE
jgi:hypothetical protein